MATSYVTEVDDRGLERLLRVAGGRAEAVRGGSGEIRLGVDSLASLYSGLSTAQVLRVMGELDGPDDAMIAASTVFAGPTPSMPDVYRDLL